VAKGNQFPGPFCRLYGSDSRNSKEITFRCVSGTDQFQRGWLHLKAATSCCFAFRWTAITHVNHVNFTCCVEVGEAFFHVQRFPKADQSVASDPTTGSTTAFGDALMAGDDESSSTNSLRDPISAQRVAGEAITGSTFALGLLPSLATPT
jgi:hypothetical protein